MKLQITSSCINIFCQKMYVIKFTISRIQNWKNTIFPYLPEMFEYKKIAEKKKLFKYLHLMFNSYTLDYPIVSNLGYMPTFNFLGNAQLV